MFQKTPSGGVYLFLQQRHPKFRLAGNENFHVDDENIIPVSYNDAARLPVVSRLVTKIDGERRIVRFCVLLWRKILLECSNRTNLHLPRQKNWTCSSCWEPGIILLGNLKDYEKKLHKLKNTLMKKGSMNLVELLQNNWSSVRKSNCLHKPIIDWCNGWSFFDIFLR